MAAAADGDAKLQLFLRWLQANGVELRGCSINRCGPNKGFGVFFTTARGDDGVVMVVPLELAITPMRVLQDPLLGPRLRALFEEGHVDDRFLVMLFLALERLRPDSPWKPYLDMLPTTFGNPLWFTEDELDELKGTTLYQATVLQKKKLQALYNDKVKGLLEDLLQSDKAIGSVGEVQFEDFLWANSIFWTRALNIPLPHSYVFPDSLEVQGNSSVCDHEAPSVSAMADKEKGAGEGSISACSETLWVEGLVPGIDFCNHDLRALATWEVDNTGSITGVSTSMYLILADQESMEAEKEIFISYGNKGNEELLYLYGFVLNNNPDDYLMVHYPMEALQEVPFADSKIKLIEIQKAELRCLLPRSLLDHGFFTDHAFQDKNIIDNKAGQISNYSWSGKRKVPSYLNKLVFPQAFITALRTIAMQEHELTQVSSLLDELVGCGEERQPFDSEVQAAVWEACGDYGALELLVDLLRVKLMQLEEGSGTEACDAKLLEKFHCMKLEDHVSKSEINEETMSQNRWSSIVYRRGQKQLTSLFLKEAEHALELCASEQ